MKRLQEIREAAHLTQVQLAKNINVSQQTISLWEAGEAKPRADKLPELAKILGCTIDELFEEER